MSTFPITQQREPATGRWAKGSSGNPAGRPRGRKNKSTLLREEPSGEKGLASHSPRHKDDRIPLGLPEIRTQSDVAKAAQKIVKAVNRRHLTPTEGLQLSDLVRRCLRDIELAREAGMRFHQNRNDGASRDTLSTDALAKLAADNYFDSSFHSEEFETTDEDLARVRPPVQPEGEAATGLNTAKNDQHQSKSGIEAQPAGDLPDRLPALALSNEQEACSLNSRPEVTGPPDSELTGAKDPDCATEAECQNPEVKAEPARHAAPEEVEKLDKIRKSARDETPTSVVEPDPAAQPNGLRRSEPGQRLRILSEPRPIAIGSNYYGSLRVACLDVTLKKRTLLIPPNDFGMWQAQLKAYGGIDVSWDCVENASGCN